MLDHAHRFRCTAAKPCVLQQIGDGVTAIIGLELVLGYIFGNCALRKLGDKALARTGRRFLRMKARDDFLCQQELDVARILPGSHFLPE